MVTEAPTAVGDEAVPSPSKVQRTDAVAEAGAAAMRGPVAPPAGAAAGRAMGSSARRDGAQERRVHFPLMAEGDLAPLLVPYADSGEAFSAALTRVLEEHGAAVVTGVLEPEECTRLEGLQQRELETGSPHPGSLAHAQGEFAWTARLHPRVRGTFASLFRTEDLSSSLDLPSMFHTPVGTAAERDNPEWLHVDQNVLTGMEHRCYQGVLYIRAACGDASSTTVLWPGSHKEAVYGRMMRDPTAAERAEFRDEHGNRYGHFLALGSLQDEATRDALLLEALGAGGARRLPIPAGALLLWDSRTVHQGWSGGQRLAVPVCWEPMQRVGAAATLRKRIIAAAGAATSHSPSEGRVHPCVATRRGPHVRLRRPQVRPYAVRSDLPEKDWERLWEAWSGDVFLEDLVGGAAPCCDGGALERALRPEVLAVL